MQQLGNLHALVGSKRAVEPIVAVLGRSSRAETLLTACTALSVLASRDDRRVLDALATVRMTHDGEVAWSAALALARLGSAAGKSTLLDLLDRTHLESGERYQVTDESGKVHRYSLERGRVDAILIAAMDAAANLNDGDLWGLIDRLRSDPSPAVRGRATEVTQRRAESRASGGKP
jgi:HEAT repeat protein